MPKRPGEVDAGLDAERVPGRERQVVAGDHVRVLVRLLADAVTDAVHEELAEAGGGDDAPGRGVDVGARVPTVAARTPASCASTSTAYASRTSAGGSPAWNMRVMSEQ